MKLSDGEKLILLMLADIYRHLQIQNPEFDPNFISNTIWNDHLWGFNWRFQGLPFETQDEPAEVSETADVLDMWYFLETAYQKLSAADKAKVKKATGYDDVWFIGFDGNNEAHFGIARYLIDDLERFDHFKGRDLNSHSHSIDGYRRMYKVFEPIRKTLVNRSLSVDEIIEIINARRI